MAFDTPFQRLRQADDILPGFPGGHRLAPVAGVGPCLVAARSRSQTARSVIRTGAPGLAAQAATVRARISGVRR